MILFTGMHLFMISWSEYSRWVDATTSEPNECKINTKSIVTNKMTGFPEGTAVHTGPTQINTPW